MVKIIEKQKILVGALIFALFVSINIFSSINVSAETFTGIRLGDTKIVSNKSGSTKTYKYKVLNNDHTKKYKITIKSLNAGIISGVHMTWDTFPEVSPYSYPLMADEVVICRSFPWGQSTLEFNLSRNGKAEITFEEVSNRDETPTTSYFVTGQPIKGMVMSNKIDHYYEFTAMFDGKYEIDAKTTFDGWVIITEEGNPENEVTCQTNANELWKTGMKCKKGKNYTVKVCVRDGRDGGGYTVDLVRVHELSK